MELKVKEIAHLLKGDVKGDGEAKIHTISKIQEAKKGSIAFLANVKYEAFIYETQASAVIVNKDFQPQKPISSALIYVEDAYSSFGLLLEEYEKLVLFQKKGIESPSFIDESAHVGENAYVGAFAYIGQNCKIGKNAKIYPHAYIGDNVTVGDNTIINSGVKVYAGCKIGNHVTIHSGTVVGSDGFGFAPQKDGSYKRIPQIGNVIIEDHVDIGANTTIDCGTMGSTVIESGVKLDNLIQIAHNVRVGKHTAIAAHTGISGSVEIGDYCVIAGQVGMIGHIKIANKTKIAAQSGILKEVKEEGTTLLGSPAIDVKDHLKSFAVFKKLPNLKQRIETLEKKILEK